MTAEAAYVLGLALVPLALLAGISAWADGRRPWMGGALTLAVVGLLGFAWMTAPEGGLPPLSDVPETALRLVVTAFR